MLLLLRRLKHQMIMNDRFRKYLAYGLGELLLVIAGILIALQIDNWNDDRKEQATLQSYLESIARNIREDLSELDSLRAWRQDSLWSTRQLGYLFGRESYDRDEIFYFIRTIGLAASERYFSPNTSGFEALKVSGVLDRLQGSSIEEIMGKYYDYVSQVGRLEASLYEATRPLIVELNRDLPRELESFEFDNPAAVDDERFADLQPAYRSHVNHPLLRPFFNVQQRNAALIALYDGLEVLGDLFIKAVESGESLRILQTPQTSYEAFNEGLGFADLVVNGEPDLTANFMVATDSVATNAGSFTPSFRFDGLQLNNQALHVDYPGGSEWAVVYWQASSISERRPYLDYSRFSELELEIKGDRGGEKLLVHVKDADYPDEISPVAVEIILGDDWETHTINLEQFAPNDFSRLHVTLGLLIHPAKDPMSFSIRNARYR